MKIALVISLLFAANAFAHAATPSAHWTYEGKAGPEHWGELSTDFHTCHTGKFQSPVDIRHTIDGHLPPLNLEFHTAAKTLVNNGHTIQVNVDDEDDFRLDGEDFHLMQYHFHTPSENQIAGKSYPLEAHFVHQSDKGDLAVVAVMFEPGAENPALNAILTALPQQENQSVTLNKTMDFRALFPADFHYYRFSGSLTTPPCTEGLRWLVMKQPVQLSQSQLAQFQKALKSSNNRPLQPLNGRMIVE
ncbi:carbonic anhydrase family protein [Candidatus Pantoea deserta]|uniref:Carbonic anhydrase n=1 Tax=Candidatus Pantoea deserta TaxID=1869313 RepID=A0A3N4NTC0_9GAMM|nr:carbonic anhydrase family protein [Pantoea deserta]RPD96296.1 carbonic anhydrase family protein [Pantoea deserta]